MNILMHTVYYAPEIGGLESHVHFLCRALAARGHTVRVVTSASLPGLPSLETVDGVNIRRTWLPARNTGGWAAHAIGSLPSFIEWAREADILHAQDIAAVLPCLVARGTSETPIVTTYHTSHFLRRADSRFWRPVFRGFLRAADHNLAASREIAGVGEAIAPGVHVEPLTNGVDTETFRHTPSPDSNQGAGRPFRLIAPRRLFEKNGVEYFVRALPLIAEHADVEALIVGDGPERDRLEVLARELGVSECARFLGARPHAEMPGLLSSCDLAVFPSLMEATSVAALEAMACELPVAATNVGGLPEIVDADVGGLCEPADPASLARLITRLLTSGLLLDLGAEARRRVVSQWSNERLTDRHEQIYAELLFERARQN
ncbi:glycosyltransferase family 4 protein [Candidatus Palauibacter sp.]|uniref:glycosyltransferase family 4 protein n=1 Tax=Candidatus Palauibacter sp. TaxID=3101350 RepID=UPI003D12F545